MQAPEPDHGVSHPAELQAAQDCEGIAHGLAEIRRMWLAGDEEMVRLVLGRMGPETGAFEELIRNGARVSVELTVRRLQHGPCARLAGQIDHYLLNLVLELLRDTNLDDYVPDIAGRMSDRWRHNWKMTGLGPRYDDAIIQFEGEARALRKRAEPAEKPPAHHGHQQNQHQVRGIFRREGEGWRVGLEPDKVVSVRDIDGMYYVAALLARPKRTISSDILYRARPRSAAAPRGMLEDAARSEGVESGPEMGQEVMNEDGLRAAYEEISRLSREIEKSRDGHDEPAVERLDAEKQEILEFLKRDTGLGGRFRVLATDLEKAGQNIGNAISRVYKGLEHKAPALLKHLKASIHGRSTPAPMYDPVQQVSWDLGAALEKIDELHDV